MSYLEPESSESNEELDESYNRQPERTVKDLEKLERERKELESNLVAGNISTLREQVAFILNSSIDSRNSDVELAWNYWQTFQGNIFNGYSVTKEDMMQLRKIPSLVRMRAKIQNDYKLFQADPEVKKFRRVLEDENRQSTVDDKPKGMGVYTVYIDETGKTQDYLSVGSLWIMNYGGGSHILADLDLRKWKKDREITSEFHFKRCNRGNLEIYKAFFIEFLSKFPEIGFKFIVVNNKGLSDKNAAIVDLTYHLIVKGIRHENSSGRAPLPRLLKVTIDEDESGRDKLKLENIKDRLTGQGIEGLYVGQFEAVASSGDVFIQAVDLFTGAVNRKLHFPNGDSPKDELAEFILAQINCNVDLVDKNNTSTDNSEIFNLT